MVDEIEEEIEEEPRTDIFNRDWESYTRFTEEELLAEGFTTQHLAVIREALKAHDRQVGDAIALPEAIEEIDE